MIQKILEKVEDYLASATGLMVLMDPQPIKDSQPHLRLTFTGSTNQGEDRDIIDFQLSIVGAGDGPDVFLTEVIRASLAVSDLYRRCKAYEDLTFTDNGTTYNFRLYFDNVVDNTGQFVQSEDNGETRSWAYIYTEPHVVRISFKSALRRSENDEQTN